MAANKRSDAQIREDRKRIARLYRRELTHQQIADELNDGRPAEQRVTRQIVTYEIRALTAAWREAAVEDVSLVYAKQLARLAFIEGEAEDAWERSKQVAEEREQTHLQDGDPVTDKRGQVQLDKAGVAIRTNSRTALRLKQKQQTGNAQYLAVMMECVRERNRIYGFYAPEKLDPRELDRMIEAELARLRSNGSSTPGQLQLTDGDSQ